MGDDKQIISLSALGKYKRVDTLRKLIFKKFGRSYFEFRTHEELAWYGLRLIEETKFVQNDPESLDKGMRIIRDYFDYQVPKSIKASGDKKEEIKNFCFFLFDITRLPYYPLQEIKANVEWDLKSINELIDHYESLDPIKSFLEGNSSDANRSSIITHFYGRCVEERKKILNYYMDGMYLDAMNRAVFAYGSSALLTPMMMMNDLFTPSYNYGKFFARRNYDYRKIDKVSHRLYATNIPIKEFQDHEDLYHNDKSAFYSKLFGYKATAEFFEDIKYSISLLRLSNERIEIFKELERLFNSKEWLAFYAIALPQVEGLFSEMINVSNSGANRNALPAKVRAVRNHSNSNERTFDYYEYVLPEQRNRFAHGGLVGDYELRAYDLLTDLESVLTIFTQLENPFVKVSRLLARKNIIDFPDMDSIATYLYTLDKLTPAQRESLKTDIEEFNKNFLMKDCQLEIVTKQALVDYKRHLEKISSNFSGREDQYELPSLNFKGKITSLITDFNKSYLQMTFLHNDNEIAEILVFDHLIQGIKKWFIKDGQNEFLVHEIKEWQNDKLIFHNLKELKNMLSEINPN